MKIRKQKIEVKTEFEGRTIYAEITLPFEVHDNILAYLEKRLIDIIDYTLERQARELVSNVWNTGIYHCSKAEKARELGFDISLSKLVSKQNEDYT